MEMVNNWFASIDPIIRTQLAVNDILVQDKFICNIIYDSDVLTDSSSYRLLKTFSFSVCAIGFHLIDEHSVKHSYSNNLLSSCMQNQRP